MKSEYYFFDSKTFDIEQREDFIPIDEKLAKTISTLNKKGYYTESCNKARISTPFLMGTMVHDLIEENIIEINDNTKDKIEKIIKQNDYESTFIVFKEKYNFMIYRKVIN